MMPQSVRWFMVGLWLVLLLAGVGILAREVGGLLALLLTLITTALAQMVYGVLCRRVGKPSAQMTYRVVGVLLIPATFVLQGAAGDLTTVVLDVCQLLATLNWSDDDIGGWGRRRWAQVKQAGRRFSRPVMGGVAPRT